MDLIDRYRTRIALPEDIAADALGLAAVVAAHRLAIPFENLDILLGRGIAIGSEAVVAKLVEARRGGYCFEHNRLLGDCLTALGFTLRPLLARVRLGMPPDACPPRTHTLLLVEIAGEPWIADAGFGGSHVPPLPLVDSLSATTPDGAEHRLLRQAVPGPLVGEWLLQRRGGAGQEWVAQYSFDLAEVAQDDLEQANHWTATRPGTRFTSNLIASRVMPAGLVSLTGLQLTRPGTDGPRHVPTAAELHAVLSGDFGIEVSESEAEQLFAFAAAG